MRGFGGLWRTSRSPVSVASWRKGALFCVLDLIRSGLRLRLTAWRCGLAMRKLPRRQAEVIVLVYFSGLSHAEAAKVMGCSVETARTHLKRAKTHLAAWLRDDE